jgi:hypothetical protein
VPLLIAFFSGSDVAVYDDDGSVVLSVDGTECELTRAEAVALRSAVGRAVRSRREFVRTAGEHRTDGSYAVERRGADSAGNAKVFDAFGDLVALYERLPTAFDADALDGEGVTGSRRHLVVRHFAEHPAFECSIDSRSPLRVRKASEVVPAD